MVSFADREKPIQKSDHGMDKKLHPNGPFY